MAIRRFIDYKVIVTKSRLRKLSKAAWFLAALTPVFALTIAAVGLDREGVHLRRLYTGLSIVALICLIAIAYFYIMVYLGIRKTENKRNHPSQRSYKGKNGI